MATKWTDLPLVAQLPLAYRLWAAYLRYGPKRSGGTLGGNILFRTICKVRMILNCRDYALLSSALCPRQIVIDLLDFESFHHTIGLWNAGSSERQLLATLLRPGMTFVDVGANHGIYSLFAAVTGGPTTMVYAFEPQPRAAESLRRSVAANRLDNIRVVEAAITDSVGTREFFVPAMGSGTGSLSKEHASQSFPATSRTVATTTLDTFVAAETVRRVDILKIDVEGHEAAVVRGAQEVLHRFQPVVWFELNPSALAAAGSTEAEIVTSLQRAGYRYFFDVHNFKPFNFPTPAGAVDVRNIAAVPDRHPLLNAFSS